MRYKILMTLMFAGLFSLPADMPRSAVPMLPVVQAQEKPTVEAAEPDDEVAADEEDAEDDDNFIPTEKINVDSSVSFPVDI